MATIVQFKGLDLNLLVALDALLTERNVTRAAERLFLTQPAMSNALARLRSFFGDELLIRSASGVLLTDRAQSLQDAVRSVLMQIESSIVDPPKFDPVTSRRNFIFCVSDYSTLVFIQPLIARAAAVAPNVCFTLIAQESPGPGSSIERGDADLVITPEQFLSQDNPSLVLFEEDYVCVTWNESKRFEDGLDFESYIAAGHVVTRFADGRAPAADTWLLSEQGVSRKAEVVATTLVAPAELVVGTDRIATVHRRLALRAARMLPIRLWPLPIPAPPLVEYLQWNQARDKDVALRWLITLCQETAAKV